jgi:hypothetical protein
LNTRSSLVVRASDCQCRSRNSPGFDPVLRIRIHIYLGLLDPEPDPLVRGMDPDPLVRCMDSHQNVMDPQYRTGSIPAFSYTVESERRQMKQCCRIQYIVKKSKKIPLLKKVITWIKISCEYSWTGL